MGLLRLFAVVLNWIRGHAEPEPHDVALDDANTLQGLTYDAQQDKIEQLEQTNEKLRKFSQMVAHDLMGPITGQRRHLQFLIEDLNDMSVPLPSDIHDHITDMDDMLSRQHKLVLDLLEWAWGQQGGAPERFDPNERMSGITKMVHLTPGFKLSIAPDIPWLFVNPVSFDLVMRNLISNAVKHHDRPGGQVQVTYDIGKFLCTIHVTDDGPGIPEQHVDRIFEPFQSLKMSKGSGLGLAFVKEVVEGWGGRVSLRNLEEGRGACLSISVPMATDTSLPHLARRLRSA